MAIKGNPNAPTKGSITRVEPIKDMGKVKEIIQFLKKNKWWRDLVLFVIGINNGLRITDLLKLKVGAVRDRAIGSIIHIRESKTSKTNVLVINKPVYETLKLYFKNAELLDDDWLFKSKRGKNPIGIEYVSGLVKEWATEVGITDTRIAGRSLRKTFAYHAIMTFKTPPSLLMERLNHSSYAITKTYVGLAQDEVQSMIVNNEIG